MITMAEFQIGKVEHLIRGDDCTMSTMLQTPISKSLFILFHYYFFFFKYFKKYFFTYLQRKSLKITSKKC